MRASRDVALVRALPAAHAVRLIRHFSRSRAQLRQDLFVLSHLNFPTGGYFVEFGACDGVTFSNTCLLERTYGWTGILAEPDDRWHEALRRHRTSALETACLWHTSGAVVEFVQVDPPDLSTIRHYGDDDVHGAHRRSGRVTSVPTLSLNDLLAKHQAPATIDYLSIDTEGSEFDILRHLDFDTYSFRVITVEHNFTPTRQQTFDLLTGHGYVRVHTALSDFDDWYVRADSA